jgi:hypothetical protein
MPDINCVSVGVDAAFQISVPVGPLSNVSPEAVTVLVTGTPGPVTTEVTYTAALTSGKLRVTFDRAVIDSDELRNPARYTIGVPAGATTPVILQVDAAPVAGVVSYVDLVLSGGQVDGGAYTVTLTADLARASDLNSPGSNTAVAASWVGASSPLTVELLYPYAATQVRVLFSTSVRQVDGANADDALNLANYTILGPGAVPWPFTRVERVSARMVVLTGSTQTPGGAYTWTISGVKDIAGNVVSDGAGGAAVGNFTGFVQGTPSPLPESTSTLAIGNLTPGPNSIQQNPLPTVYFDVVDSGGFLDPTTIKATVFGVLVYDGSVASRFLAGWTGVVTPVTNGIHVVMVPPWPLGDDHAVEVVVVATTTYGKLAKRAWTFRTYPATEVLSVTRVSAREIQVNFTPGVQVGTPLLTPANYTFTVKSSRPVTVPVAVSVTAPSAVPGAAVANVRVTLETALEAGSQYALVVEGPVDEFSRIIETTESTF